MAKFDFDAYEKAAANQSAANDTRKVGYFNSLKDDGDEAIVRFVYTNPSEFDIETVHSVKIGENYRYVSCLRNAYEPLDNCPLCKKGEQIKTRMFVKMLEYVKNTDGTVTAQAKIWDRPANFSKKLKSLLEEYGALSDVVFKIKRRGKKGDLKTEYDILFANPSVYNANIYVKDFSAFKDFDLSHHSYYEKSFEDIQQFVVTGEFPEVKKTQQVPDSVVQQAQQMQQQYNQQQATAQMQQYAQAEENPYNTQQPARPERKYVY